MGTRNSLFKSQAVSNASTIMTEALPQLLPVLKATSIEARSVDVNWTYGNRDPRYLFPDLSYQLSRAEADTLLFEVVYEGDEPMFTLRDLKPMTSYRLKLRIDFTKNALANTGTWSKGFSELEFSTIGTLNSPSGNSSS